MKKTRHRGVSLQNSGLRGYRLHDARIAHSSGKDSMRSIKYELVSPENFPGLSTSISDLLVSDHRYLYGNINLNDYLSWRANISDQDFNSGVREVSFLGLWIKALSLGFIFSKQSEHILSDFKKLNNIPTSGEISYQLLSKDWQELIDLKEWNSWWRSTKKPSAIKKIFKKDYLDQPSVIKVIETYNENPKLKIKLEFRCQLFQLPLEKFSTQTDHLDPGVAWVCLPDFPAEQFAGLTDWTEILDRIIAHYESKNIDMSAKAYGSKCLGLYDGQNRIYAVLGNFFNFLKLKDLEAHTANLAKVFGFSKQQQQVILERFEILKEYAKSLPEKPHLVHSWAEYRSSFGSILESWYSNRVVKQKNTKEQLLQFRQLLSALSQVLSNHSIQPTLLNQAIDLIDRQNSNIDRSFTLELDSFLSEIRSSLNELAQKNPELAKDLANITSDKLSSKQGSAKILWQKELGKHLQASPLFFGESKRLLWEEVYQLKPLINRELDQLIEILQSPISRQAITDKQVDMLAQLFQRLKSQGNPEVLHALKTISSLLSTNFEQRDDTHRYYISRYSSFQQERVKLLEFKPAPLNELFDSINLSGLLKSAKLKPQSDFLLRDVVGLSKVLISAAISDRDPDFRRQIVKTHSNLQGYSALISKQKFISRYNIQSVSGGQSVLAIALAPTRKGNLVERYFYAFKDLKELPQITLEKISNANPAHNPDQIAEPKKSNTFTALAVQSSRYQIQFLDWFFGKHTKKKTSLKLQGAFTIAEQLIDIDWAKIHPQVHIKNKRLFVSQPFTICPLNISAPNIKTNRFIGVDIGEYGLAWSLIQVESNVVKQIDSGFIADPQQQKLKHLVLSFRQDQAKQTFTSPNTKIARLRESLIGAYRNELTKLSLKYQARLSFEYEVDAFESGGNKISRIYSSIKRSFIYRKENEPDIALAFGKRPVTKSESPEIAKKFNLIHGFETTAAGTSRFCTKCLRWADLSIDKTKDYKLYPYDDNLFKIKIGDGEVRLLGKQGKTAGESIIGQEAARLIYKAMRPNEDGFGFRIIERHPKSSNIKQTFGKNKPRGNIGVFVCPYIDCHHITDADLQAAFNIAVRGYLKSKWQEKYTTENARKNNPLNKEALTKATAELKFQPISTFED